jgi:hypothetical protein
LSTYFADALQQFPWLLQSGKGRVKEKKLEGLKGVSRKTATSLRGKTKILLTDEGQGEIVQGGHGASGVTDFQATTIFLERNITAIVETIFDLLVGTDEGQQATWISFGSRQGSQTINDLGGHEAGGGLRESSFELKDLSQIRPGHIIIKQGRGG